MANVVRLSPGVYMVNGQRINAPTSAAALNQWKKQQQKADKKANQQQEQESSQPAQSDVPKVNPGNANSIIAAQEIANKNAFVANNPNQSGPFGSQYVTVDPATGQPTVTQTLDPAQQALIASQTMRGTAANDMATAAIQGFTGGALDLSSAPALMQTSDALAERQRIEEALYQNFRQDLDRNKARDFDSIQQMMADRGVPVEFREGSLFGDAYEGLNRHYGALDQNARAQAMQHGGAEMQRNIELQNAARQGFIGEQLLQRNLPLQDAAALANLNTSAYLPTFSPFAGVDPVNVGSAANVAAGVKLGQQQLAIQKQKAAAAGGAAPNNSPIVGGAAPGFGV